MDVTRMLRDLYAERRWLSAVIGALEIGSHSPRQQFTAILAGRLSKAHYSGPLIQLRRREKAEITQLVNLIRRTSNPELGRSRKARIARARVLPFR